MMTHGQTMGPTNDPQDHTTTAYQDSQTNTSMLLEFKKLATELENSHLLLKGSSTRTTTLARGSTSR
eukprot:c28371_g1_i1 orf=112-312(+)